MPPAGPRSGDAIFASVERVNAELFTLTYGATVRQLLTDLEEVEEVNKQLDQMGYNIGIRLIDEFLAKSNISRCVDFKETADVIAKVGLKMFLGVNATVANWDTEGTCCSIVLEDNPLVDFVELPDTCQGLHYCNILSGVIRGALEMVSMKTEVTWLRDMLRGDDTFELQVKLLKQIPEEYPYKDDETRRLLPLLLQVHLNFRLRSSVLMAQPSNPQTQMLNRILLHSSPKSVPKFVFKFHRLLRSAPQEPEQRQVRLLRLSRSQPDARRSVGRQPETGGELDGGRIPPGPRQEGVQKGDRRGPWSGLEGGFPEWIGGFPVGFGDGGQVQDLALEDEEGEFESWGRGQSQRSGGEGKPTWDYAQLRRHRTRWLAGESYVEFLGVGIVLDGNLNYFVVVGLFWAAFLVGSVSTAHSRRTVEVLIAAP